MNDPKVSIILVNYNHKLLFEQALKSVVSQTYNNKEIIVVDDGSEKDIANFVIERTKEFGVKCVVLDKNYGLSHARNEGIIASDGEWILLVDSDDVLPNWSVKKLIGQIDDNTWMLSGLLLSVPQDFCSENNLFMILRSSFLSNLLMQNFKRVLDFIGITTRKPWKTFGNTSTLYNRRVFKKFGLYDEDLTWAEDTEFKRRIMTIGNIKPKRCFIVTYLYRMHPKQMTKAKVKSENVDRLIEEHIKIRAQQGIVPENTRILLK